MSENQHVKFMEEVAAYFDKQPSNGEDSIHWANVYNAKNARAAAAYVSDLERRLEKAEACSGMKDRRGYSDDGSLDEIVASGGAHLERLGKKDWFLVMVNSDRSSTAIWFEGKFIKTEDRPGTSGDGR